MASPFATLLATVEDRTLPPVATWQPDRVGSIDIRINAAGDWFHDGQLIKRFSIAKVFSTILRREGNEFFLVTPVEKLKIVVEDAPFIALDFEASGADPEQRLEEQTGPQIAFAINVGDVVVADAEHPIRVEETAEGPRPYVHVRDGLDARIARSAFYRLVDLAEVDDRGVVSVCSGAERFILGTA